MKHILKSLFIGVATILLASSCQKKEQQFEKTFIDTWTIDYLEVWGQESELTGTVTFSKKKSDFTSEYAITANFYKGEFNFSDGSSVPFSYEYFQQLSNEDMRVNIWLNDETFAPVFTEMLTKDTWIFFFSGYEGVPSNKYYLSK